MVLSLSAFMCRSNEGVSSPISHKKSFYVNSAEISITHIRIVFALVLELLRLILCLSLLSIILPDCHIFEQIHKKQAINQCQNIKPDPPKVRVIFENF